jgi:hypothetical protein
VPLRGPISNRFSSCPQTDINLDQLTALVKTRLVQYRPHLIEGLIVKAGLDLQPA